MATEKELRLVLDKIFDECVAKGYLKREEKKNAIDNVVNSIPAKDLKNMDLREAHKSDSILNKTLKIGLVAGAINAKDPKAKLNIGLLFKDNYTAQDRKDLKNMLTKMKQYPDGQKVLANENIDKLVNEIVKNAPQKDKKNEIEPKLELHEESHDVKLNKLMMGSVVLGSIATVAQTGMTNDSAMVDVNAELKNDLLSADSGISKDHVTPAPEFPVPSPEPAPEATIASPEPAPETPVANAEPAPEEENTHEFASPFRTSPFNTKNTPD